jgi:regulator of protease activity HflC (stomatin/prohibitin superfamily)
MFATRRESLSVRAASRVARAITVIQDFQLREVSLGAQVQSAVDSKVAAQQKAEQQKFELATARQVADVSRIQALATADAQQILACGGEAATATRNGQRFRTVTPNPITKCSQAQLTPEYLQFTYIQALAQLVNAPGSSTIVPPFDQNLTPLVNVPSK